MCILNIPYLECVHFTLGLGDEDGCLKYKSYSVAVKCLPFYKCNHFKIRFCTSSTTCNLISWHVDYFYLQAFQTWSYSHCRHYFWNVYSPYIAHTSLHGVALVLFLHSIWTQELFYVVDRGS